MAFPRNFVWCNFFNSYGFERFWSHAGEVLVSSSLLRFHSKAGSLRCVLGELIFTHFHEPTDENVIKIVAQHLPLSYCVWIWGAKGRDHKFHSLQSHCATTTQANLCSDSLCRRMSAMLSITSHLEFRQLRDRNKVSHVRAHLESRNLRFSHDLARQKLPCSEIPESDEQKNFENNRRAKKYEFSLRFDDRVIWRRCKPIFASFSFSSSSIFSIIQVSDFFLRPRCFLLALYATFSTTHATNFSTIPARTWDVEGRRAKVLVVFAAIPLRASIFGFNLALSHFSSRSTRWNGAKH